MDQQELSRRRFQMSCACCCLPPQHEEPNTEGKRIGRGSLLFAAFVIIDFNRRDLVLSRQGAQQKCPAQTSRRLAMEA
jgi:hypothetical protein